MSFDSIARADKINLYKRIIEEESMNKQKLEQQRLLRVREASVRAMNELHNKLDEEAERYREIYGENISLMKNPAVVEGGFVDAKNLGEYKKIIKKRELKNKAEEAQHETEASPFQQSTGATQSITYETSDVFDEQFESNVIKLTRDIESENINTLTVPTAYSIYDLIVKAGSTLNPTKLSGYLQILEIIIKSIELLVTGWILHCALSSVESSSSLDIK